MRFDILTLFPTMFEGPFTESILKRAQSAGLIQIHLHNIRDYATDKHHMTDDTPSGGGGGMVMKVDPLVYAIEAVRSDDTQSPVILMSPQGRVFTQKVAQELSQHDRLIFVCGRYEGVDERVRQLAITDEISIGDYVLTGGELPAMVIVDAVSRLVPDVLGARWAADEDSHATGLLEYPQYTRPAEFRGLTIPEILTSGNHQAVEKWRREQSLHRTFERRPDLLDTADLTPEDRAFIAKLTAEKSEDDFG